MAIPGDRVQSVCKGCGLTILLILNARHKWMPCDPTPFKVDGKRVLLFPDGASGREHAKYELGHSSHFDTCPKREELREEKQAQQTKHVIACGCFGGNL